MTIKEYIAYILAKLGFNKPELSYADSLVQATGVRTTADILGDIENRVAELKERIEEDDNALISLQVAEAESAAEMQERIKAAEEEHKEHQIAINAVASQTEKSKARAEKALALFSEFL